MKKTGLALAIMVLTVLSAACHKPGRDAIIVCPAQSSPQERLAAAELRRYLYLRTGELVPVATLDSVPEGKKAAIVIALKDQPGLATVLNGETLKSVGALGPEEYLIKTASSPTRTVIVIAGGDPAGALYGAYRYAEAALDVRFYLHGDVVPDAKMEFKLPAVEARGKPLFRVRGIQPFHDFPEGPDWWNADEYKAVLAQLPKLGMNFLGLHTYPEGNPNAEPTVWIGREDAIGPDGRVRSSYPSSWQNTLRGNWGYESRKTSDFPFGAAELFAEDAHGPEVMKGLMPEPKTPEDANALFERAGAMLGDVFSFARRLSVLTCVGTETPLTVPAWVQNSLRAQGLNPRDPAVVKGLYRGMFERLRRTSPPDYYWFWTTEGWTWSDASRAEVEAVTNDLKLAVEASKELGSPFRLATCGWVLGPPSDRDLFDRVLPKDVTVSCINREVGRAPVDTAFAHISGRSKWAIPWLEDDPSLTSPQLWAGRMRKDAADARAYGCDGLLGIHWRTRVLSANAKALAQAAWDWDQRAWNPEPVDPATAVGPVNGVFVYAPGQAISGADKPAVYQDVRDKVFGYHIPVPNGKYAVTLEFCELQADKRGQRVFDVTLQGKKVLERLDIFEAAGRSTRLDFTYMGTLVSSGRLDIEFADRIGYPCIAGIVIQGPGFTKRINCGGPALDGYEADWPETPRFAPISDFYDDWAGHQFGTEAGAAMAAIFTRVDGRFRIPVDWVGGPGGLRPDARPWTEAAKDYAFVDELEALRPKVRGTGNLDRFDYWLSMFRYAREVAHLDCLAAEYAGAAEGVRKLADDGAKKQAARQTLLPLRLKIVGQVKAVFAALLPTVGTTGELGTVANWAQHILPSLLDKPGEELEGWLGEKLPAEALLGRAYEGTPRLFILTNRTLVAAGESLRLKVIVLASSKPDEAFLMWRKLGRDRFAKIALKPVGRGVFEAALPPLADDIEYYAGAKFGKQKVVFPATAPGLNASVVVMK